VISQDCKQRNYQKGVVSATSSMHSIVSNYSLSISSCSIFKKIIVTFSEPLFFVYIIVLELWRSPNYRLATVTFENVLVTKEFLSHFTIRICTVLGMRGKRR
jgi:hypothetical protein